MKEERLIKLRNIAVNERWDGHDLDILLDEIVEDRLNISVRKPAEPIASNPIDMVKFAHQVCGIEPKEAKPKYDAKTITGFIERIRKFHTYKVILGDAYLKCDIEQIADEMKSERGGV